MRLPIYLKECESDTYIRTITAAWQYCEPLYQMKVRDLRPRHLRTLLDTASKPGKNGVRKYASAGTKGRIKSLFNLMLDYALENEIVVVNYARAFDLSADIIRGQQEDHKGHMCFTPDEWKTLWDNAHIPYVNWILIQSYMGWRPQELCLLRMENVHLEEGYIVGGMKTEAGKDRIVPINPLIKDMVENNVRRALSQGSEFLLVDPDRSRDDVELTYAKYRYRFRLVMEALHMDSDHRPHDPRKQYISMAKRAGVDEYALKRIVGHSINDVTEMVYTDRGANIAWLFDENAKIGKDWD